MNTSHPSLEIASNILKRAVASDSAKQYAQSLLYYQEGIEILLSILKEDIDIAAKSRIRQNVENYMDRAEKIKRCLESEKNSSSYHEQIKITDGDKGFSYMKIFGDYCDGKLTIVEIDDPYIREAHQLYNLVRLCEVFIKKRCPLRKIVLQTHIESLNSSVGDRQSSAFAELTESLKSFNIIFTLINSDTLHDREVRFNTGWIFRLGRGLSYFKRPEPGMFSIGSCDMDLRPCHECTIDIFHRSSVKTSKQN